MLENILKPPPSKREDFLDANNVVCPIVTQGAIYGLYGEYRCLSNFHSHPVTFEGLTYQSSEAAYMAQKTLDPKIKLQFSKLQSGKEAKELGQKIKLREGWDSVHRIHAMYRVLFAKFSQDPKSMATLLSTGDRYIEESNWWGDQFWGKCAGIGHNHLGQTLMTIRDFVKPQ